MEQNVDTLIISAKMRIRTHEFEKAALIGR
jgi:hypothetical protein